ncbi:MAG TPA: hypothetical protein VJV78_06950 [Polyangiales bacterium]|nr:hypothetical protein [Polyangiales bacterium]
MTRALRRFAIGLGCIAALAVGLRLWISAHAWFSNDDFFFLDLVQSPSFSWREVFLPTRSRLIAGYRPLGLDGYFYWNFALFGWSAFGYYLSALVLQCATAAVVLRIAQQLSFEPRSALLAAVLTACAGPTLFATYAVNEHNYLVAALCYAASVSWFLDYLSVRRPRTLVLSSGALLVGTLSNDVCATLPLLLFGVASADAWVQRERPAGEPLWRSCVECARSALAATWPHFILAALFVDFRLNGVPKHRLSWFYEMDLGLDAIGNTLGNLGNVFGSKLRLLALALLLVLVIRRGGKLRTGSLLLPLYWLVLGFLPFAVLALPATRFALLQLPAAALCVAWLATALLRGIHGEGKQNAALLALALGLIPWEGTLDVLRSPPGRVERDAFLVAKDALAGRAPDCVRVLCAGEGMANLGDCGAFKEKVFGGMLFHALVPQRSMQVEFEDVRLNMNPYYAHMECVRFELRPDQSLVPLVEPAASHATLSQAD